jgi:hypothetical protein
MQSPNYIQIISQLKLVVNELQNHLGKPKINFVSLSIISIFFFFLDQCAECFISDLPSSYLEYISTCLLPELQALFFKYSTWWSFKSDSSLQLYLKKNNIFLNNSFYPEQLYIVIMELARKKNMFEQGNENIIIPDMELQQCFQTHILYAPDLLEYCKNQVIPVSNDKSIQLLNQSIHNELYVNVPENIIYNDPSSLFWLHPDINKFMTYNKKIVFTWKELNDLFFEFITSNNIYFYRKNETIFYINENTEISDVFKFKYFHIDQIENILKQITKFLGKSNTIEQCCKNIKFSNANKEIFMFIDTYINNFNKLLPNVACAIDLNNSQ